MNIRINRDGKGYTLVEILSVILILSLVLTSVFSLYQSTQKSTSMQDEVVDVQQNLRIAMDAIARDLRHAGFLFSEQRDANNFPLTVQPVNAASRLNGNNVNPLSTAQDNSASTTVLPLTDDVVPGLPARRHADRLIVNTASPSTVFAKIRIEQTGIAAPFNVRTVESVNAFNVGDRVRIFDPTTRDQPTNYQDFPAPDSRGRGTVFRIAALNPAARTITLLWDNAFQPFSYDPSTTKFKAGNVIARVSSLGDGRFPNTVEYCLGPAVNCAFGVVATCPAQGPRDQTRCLIRLENGVADVVASRISGLQFTYLMDDGTELATPAAPAVLPDIGAVRAVRVTITGRTASVSAISSGATTTEKSRQLMSIVQLKNRLIIR